MVAMAAGTGPGPTRTSTPSTATSFFVGRDSPTAQTSSTRGQQSWKTSDEQAKVYRRGGAANLYYEGSGNAMEVNPNWCLT
jgi:hypothetical protein